MSSHEFLMWLLFASCKGATIGAIVFVGLHAIGKRLSAQSRALAWQTAMAAFVIPIGWSLPLSTMFDEAMGSTTPAVRAGETSVFVQPFGEIADTTGPIETVAGSSGLTNSPTTIAVSIWVLGALVLFALLIANHIRFARVGRAAQRVEQPIQDIFDDCRSRVGVSRRVRLVQSQEVRSPMMFGVWSPTLMLPSGLAAQLSRQSLRHVFLHELVHVRRWDVLVRWITALVQALHWFNPMAWTIAQKLRDELESACDAGVLSRLDAKEHAAYGHTLIQVAAMPAHNRFVAQVGVADSHVQLKARIQMISQHKLQRASSVSSWLMLLLLAPLALAQRSEAPKKADVNVDMAASQKAVEADSVNKPVESAGQSLPRPSDRALPKNSANPKTKVEYFKIQYVDAGDVKNLIDAGSGIALLSPNGHVAVDTRTNTLLVNDTTERVAAVRELVAKIDVPLRRVALDARIVLVNKEASHELFARAADANPFHKPVRTMSAGFDADAELAALQSARKGELISAPRVITGNRKEATIKQGIEFPAGEKVELTVTSRPVITPDGRVHVYLTLRRENLAGPSAGDEADPTRDTIQISTEQAVDDGQTLVLSGLLTHKPAKTTDAASATRDLLVFLTPKLVTEEASKNF